ncbi:MAG: hypothetical protein ACI4ON_03290 [Clostridia bacterium]
MDENNSNENLDQENKLEEKNTENASNIEINNTTNKTNTTKEIKNTSKEVKYVEKKDKKTRKGDREIVVEYRKPSIFTSVLLILIGCMIATIVLLLVYIFKVNKEVVIYEEPKENVVQEFGETSKEEMPEMDLNINGEFIKELYRKVPINYFAQEIYNYQRTTEASLTGNQKMLFVLLNMRDNKQYEVVSSEGLIDRLEKTMNSYGEIIKEVQKYEIKDVEDYLKSVFGNKQEIVKEDIETNMGFVFEYDKKDDCFYGHEYAGGGGFGFTYQTVLDSADKNENGTEVYIYDYYIKSEQSLENNKEYKIYTYCKNSDLIGTEVEDPSYFDIESKRLYINEDIINKYKENGLVKFKHTFKLDENGNYYWYCCEPVK